MIMATMYETKRIDITPDKTIYPKLGRSGYTISEALGELIDNSIDAREDRVVINIKLDKNAHQVIVEDNGRGMEEKQAIESIALGKSNKTEGQLGQFGLGLKTACMSLGKSFVIETTSSGDEQKYLIPFDEEKFVKDGSWKSFEMKIAKDINKQESGTKITIDKLRFKFHQTLIQDLKERLSERFTPFIRSGEATIKVNGETLQATSLKIVKDTAHNFEIILSNGSKVHGWTGILEVGSIERSGFNLYRYNRLIRAHEKLGYIYHPSKMWIAGDIHLDPIPVTHNKREFITEDPLYAEFFEKFVEILKPVLAEAQRRHREEKIKDLSKEVRETLKDNLLKAIDKVDDFKDLAFPEPLRRSDDGSLLDREQRNQRDIPITDIRTVPRRHNKKRTPNKTTENKVRYITIAGKRYRFDYEWQQLDENVPKHAFLDKEKWIINVLLNSRYHLLNVVKPDLFYIALYVIEGVVEVFLKENNQPVDRLIPLRDKLATELADVISEDAEEKTVRRDNQVMEAQSYLLKQADQGNEKELTDREKEILELRLEKGMSSKDVAKMLGLSRQRVYSLWGTALQKINSIEIPKKPIEKKMQTVVGLRDEVPSDASTVIQSIADKYSITTEDLFGKKRNAELVLPRHLAMYLLRSRLKLSFPKIAKITKRDHTTIMHACTRIEKLIQEERVSLQ